VRIDGRRSLDLWRNGLLSSVVVVPHPFKSKARPISVAVRPALSQVRELAAREGISINQFVATAVAEKMSALMTEEYLEGRAKRGSREGFERAMATVKDRVPDTHDQIL
jgi:hypothetical protein